MKKLLVAILAISISTLVLEIATITKTKDKNNSSSTEVLILQESLIQSLVNSRIAVNDVYISIGGNSDQKRLLDIVEGDKLFFRFSGEECDVCIDFVISSIKDRFPDYEHNDKIIFLGSNLNQRTLKNYYGKPIYYLNGEYLGLPAEEYSLPCLFILDSSGITKFAFIPDKLYPDITKTYLEIVKEKFLD